MKSSPPNSSDLTDSLPIVSVVIPTFDRHEQLSRLVQSIENSNYPAINLEIVIIDNRGDLDEREIKGYARAVKVSIYKQEKNLFSGGGRLFGSKKATGDYIFFIDDDNVLDVNCIRRLVKAFSSNPRFGLLAPLMLHYSNKDIIWCAGGKISPSGFPRYLHTGKDIKNFELPKLLVGADYYPNAFMVKLAIVKKVPIRGKTFPHNWNETDFCYLILKSGYLIGTVTNALDWHDINYTGKLTRLSSATLYDQAASRIVFRRAHMRNLKSWSSFWLVIYPLSTVVYLKKIISSSESKKLDLVKTYFKATVGGILQPIADKE